MGNIISALLVFFVGFIVGHSSSVELHRARCTQLGGIPVVQIHDNTTTVLCQRQVLIP